jgi:hypothetical protein
MRQIIALLVCLVILSAVLTGCSLQQDTYEILYSIPSLTEEPPEIPQTTVSAGNQPTQSSNQEQILVWVSNGGGAKYHKLETCSGMADPKQITIDEAIDQGYTHCKKCYSELD